MAELVVRFDLKFDNRLLRLGLVGAALLAMAPELASESVSLTTYYPAPSGVYTQMTVTGNTFLARDSGGVAIGTSANPAANVMLMVTDPTGATNTRVGIGTTGPGGWSNGTLAMLDVQGPTTIGRAGTPETGLTVQGVAPELVGKFGANPGIWASADNGVGGGILIGQNGGFFDYEFTDGFGMTTYNGGTGLRIAGSGGFGSGGPWTSGNGGNLYVNGSIGADGGAPWVSGASIDVGNVILTRQGCGPVAYDPAVAGSENCPAGKYVTNVSGHYANYYALGDGIDVAITVIGGGVTSAQGTMLCCNCPPGGCNAF